MDILGRLNDREIIYIRHDLAKSWFKDYPNGSWLLFAIVDRDEINIFDEVNRRAIENNVTYVCSAGSKCERFHDNFDEELEIREAENNYLPQYCIPTTWHDKFDEGLWFTAFAAIGDEQEINKIVCLDITTTDMRSKLVYLIKKIEAGWLPD